MVAAPLFHSWGFAHFTLGLLLSTTLVLQRRFDAAATLAGVQEHRATVLAAVPVMLQRILELPDEEIERHDTSSLRVVAISGSALPGELATRFMDRFGDVVYNLYGSTEVASATRCCLTATPAAGAKTGWAG
jgi:fatty-acyl-CoA synthase